MKLDKTLDALKRLQNPKERTKIIFKIELGVHLLKYKIENFLKGVKK